MTSTYKGSAKEWWDSDLTSPDCLNAQQALVDLIIEEEYTRADMTNDVE